MTAMSSETGPHDRELAPHAPNPYEEEDRDLGEALANIWQIAAENHLDPFPTHFEIVPPKIINELASYGVPGRFSHWTFGREYRRMKTQYDYGYGKIYELVINSNPAQAFLLENNPPIENKFVMAHVLGHTDFFKNNQLFANTRRDMPEVAAKHAERIHEYEDTLGRLAVEHTLDAALALEQHVDPFTPHRPSRDEELRRWREQAARDRAATDRKRPRPGVDAFDDLFELKEWPPTGPVKQNLREILQIPPEPDSDVLGFIRNHAPHLEDWQRDIVDIVRQESLYFYPQRRTKIMNEGWAAYWHKRIMREMGGRGLLSDDDNEAWWLVHSRVVAPSKRSLNPYYLGMMMYEYIEDYYNGNLSEQENAWLVREGKPIHPKYEGELKDSPAARVLRNVMMHNDDQSFIRNHFDKNVADRMGMYIYEERPWYNGKTITVVKETGWQEIRDMLANSMVNCGIPYIEVVDGDHNDASELYLRHGYDGRNLDPAYIKKTLPYLHTLWQKNVHLETISGNPQKKVVYTYDGATVTTKTTSL